MTRNEAQNHRTESVLLTSNKNCRDINFLSVRQGQGPCLFLSDVKDSISLHNSVRYKVWNDFLSNLLTKQASFDRKSRYFYARTRDAAIKRLVILAYFKRFTSHIRELIFPQIQCDSISLNRDTVSLFPISLSYWRTKSANNVPNLLKRDSVEWVETVIPFFFANSPSPRASSRVNFSLRAILNIWDSFLPLQSTQGRHNRFLFPFQPMECKFFSNFEPRNSL